VVILSHKKRDILC